MIRHTARCCSRAPAHHRAPRCTTSLACTLHAKNTATPSTVLLTGRSGAFSSFHSHSAHRNQATTEHSPPEHRKSPNRFFFDQAVTLLAGSTLLAVFALLFASTSSEAPQNPSQDAPKDSAPPISEQELAQLKLQARQDKSDPNTVKALARLGFIYYTQLNDPQKAHSYLKQAADCNDIPSMYNLAIVLLHLNQSEDNLKTASHYLHMAAKHNYFKAQLKLPKLLLQRAQQNDSSLSHAERVKLLADALQAFKDVSHSDKDSAFQLAMLYFKGLPQLDLPQSPNDAAFYFRSAAQRSHPEAMFHYGMALKNGFGLPQDVTAGLKWIEDSAKKGCPLAMYEYGSILLKGIRGVIPMDPMGAFKFFQQASQAGNMDASYMVGHCLVQGLGVERDEKKAFEIFKALAPQDSQAKVSLGVCYAQGSAVEQNFQEAARLWQLVLDEEETRRKHSLVQYEAAAEAAFNLGICYANGFGVPQDEDRAKELFSHADLLGYAPARQKLQEMN